MKKFLSLVLALVMTMSLVTIGAGATEYKDLTDKKEIQYEEAVAVLNKLGIITGYEDGSFKPTGALTRGAAAKIIVSLMIGSDAASSLTVAAAPYKDVPVTNTFAAVISYCKTAGYINGYSDGTFRPTAALTGYAFAKMLLGALGYKGTVEGFSGSGWTMKVASVGNTAGLYNDFNTPFQGNAGITREQACQLALNTLKATEVEYKGDKVNVTGSGINVSIDGSDRQNVVNTSKTDGNIYKTGSSMGKDGYMQFAEEHFTDLKQVVGTITDDFGRPSNKWSFKNVTIGTYAKTADFSFTANGSGDSSLDKLKSLGIDGYKVDSSTSVMVNNDNNASTVFAGATSNPVKLSSNSTWMNKLTDLFGNGVAVQVFIDDTTADLIKAIVVIRTEMMEVNSVSSKNVSLKQADDTAPHQAVATVKDTDDAFASLKGLKVEDYTLVTYRKDGANYVVDSAAAPQTVTGALTAVSRNDKNEVNGVTVGGTAYKLAKVKDFNTFKDLTAASISATKKDVTLYLDAYGYATYIKDAGSTSNYMIIGDSYQTLVNGKLVKTLTGWDMKGVETSINIGTANPAFTYGDLVKYESTSDSNADYKLIPTSAATNPAGGKGYVAATGGVDVNSYDNTISGTANGGAVKNYYFASGVKTIFEDFNGGTTVDSIFVKDGVANIDKADLVGAQLYINGDGAVEAIVVKMPSKDAISNNTMFIEYTASSTSDNGTKKYTYNVWVDGVENPDGQIVSTDNISGKTFVTYTKNADGTYKLSKVSQDNTATSSFRLTLTTANIRDDNKNLVYGIGSTAKLTKIPTGNWTANDGVLVGGATELNLSTAKWADLTDNGFSSLKDLANSDLVKATDTIYLTIVLNNKTGADNRLKVAQVVVNGFGTTAPII
ncbi:MAG: S-layer homology domain-containing protein [Oscillibacter ruminantium]|uniref:S-layer homology domain-containing protein n=1 Tax=Oscillibacter ruminantium TaxID=1263547 RepID=UPI002B1F50DE|nr:S-layer homology domain-containing protein [Oscillibacter ruminantium]MEA5042613.1 S-layer homology domain-containing protein [Oscillibacter ruminantium]